MTASPPIEAFLAEPRNVIVAGVRRDGRPHLSPNWFLWDGEKFYVSTTRPRVKYKIFRRDPRVELAVDDATGHRTVLVSGTVEILEDVHQQMPLVRAIRDKHGHSGDSDEEVEARLVAEERVLLAITPSTPPEQWTTWGLD